MKRLDVKTDQVREQDGKRVSERRSTCGHDHCVRRCGRDLWCRVQGWTLTGCWMLVTLCH
jgi:hypothetical protein